jgi:hypothetical protein
MEMKVVHKDGEWFVNTAVFRFVDPTNEADPVIFEPGVPTKVRLTEWIASQPMIVSSPDPMASDEPIPTVIVPTESTLVPNDDQTGVPDASSAPGIQGTSAEAVAAPAPAPAPKRK